MPNPSLPPSLAAEFREDRERLDALERGDRSLAYRQPLSTNDASNAREMYTTPLGNGQYAAKDSEAYSAALVNPRYPVLVARFHVFVIGNGGACEVYLRANMGTSSRSTRRWSITGSADGNYRSNTFEIAWLHGMPVDQWDEIEAQTLLRRGNVEIHANVTGNRFTRPRNADFSADALGKGFTASQTEFLAAWVTQSEVRYPVLFREPEYVFLAPLAAFPMASIEGSLITGSDVPGYPIRTEALASTARSSAEGPAALWPDEDGIWPMPPRDFGY
ncbi:MAG: hypothetical protein ABIQ18_39795 [Umezawaea sp.]